MSTTLSSIPLSHPLSTAVLVGEITWWSPGEQDLQLGDVANRPISVSYLVPLQSKSGLSCVRGGCLVSFWELIINSLPSVRSMLVYALKKYSSDIALLSFQ